MYTTLNPSPALYLSTLVHGLPTSRFALLYGNILQLQFRVAARIYDEDTPVNSRHEHFWFERLLPNFILVASSILR